MLDRFTEIDSDGRAWDVTVLAPEDPRAVINRDLSHAPWLRERVGHRIARAGAVSGGSEIHRGQLRVVSTHELRRIEQAKNHRTRSKSRAE